MNNKINKYKTILILNTFRLKMIEVTQDLTYFISDLNSRVRTLENKYELLAERLLISNQNMIESYKRLSSEFTKINQELQNLKTTVITFKETIKKILEEMSEFSTKQEIKVLEKYINMWNPLNFVTTEEIEKIIDEKLKKGDKSAGKKKK